MAKQPRRLGRGIASLLGESTPGPSVPLAAGTTAMTREVPVTAIAPNPLQPRSHFDDKHLEELAASIRTSGIIQPVVVRVRDGNYELVAGERRWRAAQKAGLTTIPAVVRDVSDQQLLEFALIENLQREDLNPLDRARAYRQACDHFDLTPDALAQHLGEDRSTIANYIRLLDLPPTVQDLVRDGSLSMGHARSLLGLPDPPAIERLAQQAVAEAFSVRHLEALVRAFKTAPGAPESPTRKPRPKRPLIQDLEQRFADALHTRVSITEGRKKNTGKIVIQYFTLDDFDRVAERLGVDLQGF